MPVKVKIIRARDFMEISPEGKFDMKAAVAMLRDVAAAIQPPADYELLIDLRRAQWRLSTTDIWYLAAALAEHPNAFRERVAILVLPGANFDEGQFLELCAQNRGFVVRAFTNFEDAIHWLFEATTVLCGTN